jgi:hypothetical protein
MWRWRRASESGTLNNLHGLRRDVYMGRDYKEGYRRSSISGRRSIEKIR